MALVYGATAVYHAHSYAHVNVDHHGGYGGHSDHDDGGWDDGHHDYHVSPTQKCSIFHIE